MISSVKLIKIKTSKGKKQKAKEKSDKFNRQVAAIMHGVMNASRNEAPASRSESSINNVSLPSMPQHAPHAKSLSGISQVQNKISSNINQVTYDHNRNIF